MSDPRLRSLLLGLEERRRALDMPTDALALRSRLSPPVLSRLLAGEAEGVPLAQVRLLAAALAIDLDEVTLEVVAQPLEEVIERQVEKQTRRVARLVQGTMALEAQGLDAGQFSRFSRSVREIVRSQPRSRLWYA